MAEAVDPALVAKAGRGHAVPKGIPALVARRAWRVKRLADRTAPVLNVTTRRKRRPLGRGALRYVACGHEPEVACGVACAWHSAVPSA